MSAGISMESKTNYVYDDVYSGDNEEKVLYGVDRGALGFAVTGIGKKKEYKQLIDQYNKMPELIEDSKKAKVIEVVRHISKIGSIIGAGLLIVGVGSFIMGGLPLFFIPALIVGAAALVAGIACTVFLFISHHGFSSKEELAEKISAKILQEDGIDQCFEDKRIDVDDDRSAQIIAERLNGDSEDMDLQRYLLKNEYKANKIELMIKELMNIISTQDLGV